MSRASRGVLRRLCAGGLQFGERDARLLKPDRAGDVEPSAADQDGTVVVRPADPEDLESRPSASGEPLIRAGRRRGVEDLDASIVVNHFGVDRSDG